MYICADCRIELKCVKNGVGMDFGNGHIYPSDLYRCKGCGHRFMVSNKNPSYDPEYKFQTAYLPAINTLDTADKKRVDVRTLPEWGTIKCKFAIKCSFAMANECIYVNHESACPMYKDWERTDKLLDDVFRRG